MKYFIPQGTEVEVYQYDNEKFLNFEFLVIKTNKDNSFNEEQKSLSTAKRNYYIFIGIGGTIISCFIGVLSFFNKK